LAKPNAAGIIHCAGVLTAKRWVGLIKPSPRFGRAKNEKKTMPMVHKQVP